MFFWAREIAGWLLVTVGLFLLYSGWSALKQQGVDAQTIQGAVLCTSGVMVTRLGVFLIRVSTAARVVLVPRSAILNGDDRGPRAN